MSRWRWRRRGAAVACEGVAAVEPVASPADVPLELAEEGSALELVAVHAVRQAVVLIAVAGDASVGLLRRPLSVARLAGDLPVLAGQGAAGMLEVLALAPVAGAMAVLARPSIVVRRLVTVGTVLGTVAVT